MSQIGSSPQVGVKKTMKPPPGLNILGLSSQNVSQRMAPPSPSRLCS